MKLNKTRRIILNTLATYGRSVFSLFVGVFSSRWLLQGLGAEDLGLQGVVGSLITAIVIFETVMQVAVARFYAYAIGQIEVLGEEKGRDEVCHWFNVVLFIHTILPFLVVIVGYPLGTYAIRHWLVIPAERMDACLWVFRCSMVSTFISMLSVPYIAMYQARQNIVELSVFGVLRSVINFGFTFSLLYVTCDRLKYTGTFGMCVSLVILGIQMYRARKLFPECRLNLGYLVDIGRLRQVGWYFLCEMYSCVGSMIVNQGAVLIINRHFGAKTNAAMTIGNTLSSQASSLSSALTGAVLPAITSEEGAGEREKMLRLAARSSKFSVLLVLVFCIPLMAEIDEVLCLWLVNPPPYTGGFCTCILIAFVIEKLGIGHHAAISAKGKIGLYHCFVGTTAISSVLISLTLIWLGVGPVSVAVTFIIINALVCIERIGFAKVLVDMPIWPYLKTVVIPLAVLSGVSFAGAYAVTHFLPASFVRVCITSVVSVICMVAVAWPFVLDAEERTRIASFVRQRIRRGR